MTEWTAHRFSGGALALDLANTLMWRDTQALRFDRLQHADDIRAFSAAAIQYCGDLNTVTQLSVPANQVDTKNLFALRDAIDDWLRPVALGRHHPTAINSLFKACWNATKVDDPSQLAYACALSATQFFQPEAQSRIKICPNCRWLFLDRSKNQSRRWCDMKVCGNRAKARQHYKSRTQKELQT